MKAITFFAKGMAVAAASLLTTSAAQAVTYVVSATFQPYTGASYDLLSGGSVRGFFELPKGTFPFPGNQTKYVDYRYQFDIFNKNGVKIATVRDGPATYAYSYISSKGTALELNFSGAQELYVSFKVPLNFTGSGALTGGTARSGNAPGTYAYIRSGSITAIPEPASWAMMITGFGLIGGSMRRGKRTASATEIETGRQVYGQG